MSRLTMSMRGFELCSLQNSSLLVPNKLDGDGGDFDLSKTLHCTACVTPVNKLDGSIELGDLTCQLLAQGKTPHPLSLTCRQAGWWTQWTKAGKGFSPFLGLACVEE